MMSNQIKPDAEATSKCSRSRCVGQAEMHETAVVSGGRSPISLDPISPSISSQSSNTAPEQLLSSSIAPTESSEKWDSDSPLSVSEILGGYIVGAKRLRSVEVARSSESTLSPTNQLQSTDSHSSSDPSQTIQPKQEPKHSGNTFPTAARSRVKRPKRPRIPVKSPKSTQNRSKLSHKSFPTRNGLIKRENLKKYSCVECSASYEMRIELDIHMREVHGGYRCKICVPDRRFPLVGAMRRHMRKGKMCNRFQCRHCDMKFGSTALRESHVMESHGGHKCTKCLKSFKTFASLGAHLRICAVNDDYELAHENTPVADLFDEISVDNYISVISGMVVSDASQSSISHNTLASEMSAQNISVKTGTSVPSGQYKRPAISGLISQNISKRQRVSHSHTFSPGVPRGVSTGGISSSSSGVSTLSADVSSSSIGSQCVGLSTKSVGASTFPSSISPTGVLDNEINKCDRCQRTFSTKSDLKRHIRNVSCKSSVVRLPCEKCPLDFNYRYELDNHMRDVHGGYKCDKCQSSYSRLGSLKWHVKYIHTVDANEAHTCDKCEKRFARKDSLACHIKSCMKWKCDKCDMRFSKRPRLTAHGVAVHFKVDISRNTCSINSVKSESRLQSIKSENRSQSVKFENRSQSVKSENMSQSVKSENRSQSVKSESRSQSVKSENRAQSVKFENRSLVYTCGECSTDIHGRNSMDLHMEQVHGGFKCKVCIPSKSFKQYYKLLQHLNLGTCMKWPCANCDMRFTKKYELELHVSDLHCDHKCEVCSAGFSTLSALTRHVNTQVCVRSRCESCMINLPSRRLLKHHIAQVHTEKTTSRIYRYSFTCGECDTTFEGRDRMDVHMSRVHGGYECGSCPGKFTFFKNLRSHQSKMNH
eukprot:985573_1